MRLTFVAVSIIVAEAFAHAAAVTIGGTPLATQGQVSSRAGVTTVNFNGLTNGGPQSLNAGIASYTNLLIRSAGGTDIAGDNTPFASPFLFDMTVSFSVPIVYFGLYWGSPDPANTITFYNGSTAVLTFTGQNLTTQFGVPLGSGNAAYVNFTAGQGETFTRIVMSAAGSFPFEQDNHAFLPTPEPGALGLLLLSGLAFVAGKPLHRLRR